MATTDGEPIAATLDVRERLTVAVSVHWDKRQASWDAKVESGEPTAGNLGIWDELPCIDSKEVARMAPIFEKHLGVPFDVKHIRAGGYDDIDDLVADLYPKLTGDDLPPRSTDNGSGGLHDEQSTS